jgi:phosphorylase kinase alpha/beta subunit
MLKPGTEAQWCIFDPIISCIYARRYARSHSPADLQQQIHFLSRSLRQMTTSASRFGAWRCPESYYLEGDQRVPNDITPLLWTQANLWQALVMFQESL